MISWDLRAAAAMHGQHASVASSLVAASMLGDCGGRTSCAQLVSAAAFLEGRMLRAVRYGVLCP